MRKGMMAATVAAALAATGGTASADTTTQPRTIATAGAGDTTVPRAAGQGTVDAAYRTALSLAIDQARGKAEFLAQKIGATLGGAQTVTEGDGFVDCGDDEQSVGGAGQQKAASAPGGSPGRLRLPPLPKAKPKPKSKPHRRHKAAHRTATSTCSINASVTVSYAIG